MSFQAVESRRAADATIPGFGGSGTNAIFYESSPASREYSRHAHSGGGGTQAGEYRIAIRTGAKFSGFSGGIRIQTRRTGTTTSLTATLRTASGGTDSGVNGVDIRPGTAGVWTDFTLTPTDSLFAALEEFYLEIDSTVAGNTSHDVDSTLYEVKV